jgi:cephalosporin-C deacetylase
MPLMFDMPRAQLAIYGGTNPRPADFDAYWNDALTEMRQVTPDVELVQADFQAPFAECFHLYFTGVRGARIHAQYLRPKGQNTVSPAVLMFHGYAGDSGDWVDKLPYVSLGFTVAAMDCRGQGLSSDPGIRTNWSLGGHIVRGLDGPPDQLHYRQVFLDATQLAGIVMAQPRVDRRRVVVFGGSQGGGLALACAALEPHIRQCIAVHPFLCDYQRVWEIDLAKDAYGELTEYFRKFDRGHEREQEVFTRLGYIDVQFLAPRIEADVVMVVGLMDTICPPSSQFAAYNKICAEKSLWIYPDFGHEVVPGVHDRVFDMLRQIGMQK